MADYQSPLQKQLAELANWLRGNSDQVVDATKPALNYRGFPSRESMSASREAAKQRTTDAPTFLSPDWFAKLYGQKSADANAVPSIDYRAPEQGFSEPVAPERVTPALPAPVRRVTRPALADVPPVAAPSAMQNIETPPTEETDAFPAYRAPATAVPAVPAQPRQSYTDMFKEILAQKQAELKAPLTEDQKRALQLQFFLAMMSNSSKPGARIFGAMGDAGQTTLSAQQGMQKENLNRAEKERANQLETAYKMIGVRNMEDDNAARERQLRITEKHYADQVDRWRQEGLNEAERLNLLREQAKKSSWDEIKTNKGIYFLDKTSGKLQLAVDTKGNSLKVFDSVDRRPEAAKIFDLRKRDPEFKEFYDKTQAKREGEITEKDLFTAWSNNMKERAPTEQQPYDVWAKSVRGRQSDTKPDPAPNKGRVWVDDTTKERFKSDGKTWVKVQ